MIEYEKVMEKLDTIKDIQTDMRIQLGAIEEHLKTLNGQVSCNKEDIGELQRGFWKVAGGIGVIVFVISIGIQILV